MPQLALHNHLLFPLFSFQSQLSGSGLVSLLLQPQLHFGVGVVQSAEISTSGFFVTCTDGRTEASQILVLPGLAAGSGGIIITPIFDALLLL